MKHTGVVKSCSQLGFLVFTLLLSEGSFFLVGMISTCSIKEELPRAFIGGSPTTVG